MKCPVFSAAIRREYENNPLCGCECLEEECAWWDKPVKHCLWLNVSEKLSMIYLELNDIAKELTLIRPK